MGRDQIKSGSISSPPTRMYDWDLLKEAKIFPFYILPQQKYILRKRDLNSNNALYKVIISQSRK